MEARYTLQNDGDYLEQKCWNLFLREEFPQYEKFWQRHIVVLTNRPKDRHFKNNKDLKKIGKSENDVCIAQLHYTLLFHLDLVYEIKHNVPLDPPSFEYGIIRLSAVTDVADELLQRYICPKKYSPWKEEDGRKARNEWRQHHKELQWLRTYRNRILHGRIMPTIVIRGSYTRFRKPRFGREEKYLDWRNLTSASIGKGGTVREQDFDALKNLLNKAWNEVLKYLRKY